MTVSETQNVTLECQVNKPGATLTWIKDGTTLTPSERVDIQVEGTVHRLHIKQAVLSDEGEYMVTVGVAVSKAPLHVEGNGWLNSSKISNMYSNVSLAVSSVL